MSDYNFLLESRLSPEQYQVLTHVSRMAVEQGLNIYLVGGAVRDLTYGFEMVHDLDFAVEGNPQRILRSLEAGRPLAVSPLEPRPAESPSVPQVAFLESDRRTNAAELQFLNGVRAEIAMCRTDTYTRPGKPPEVAPAMIFDDLRRRDFSVNAMAVSLHPNSRGLLLDPTNGAADIERRELRVLNNRSFFEDPVRIYRLLRLASRLGFKPSERTENLLAAALSAKVWARLDPHEQGRELQAILREENPAKVLKVLAGRGLGSARFALPSRAYKLLRGQPPTFLLFLLVHHPKPRIQNRIKDVLHKYSLIRARLPRAEFQAMGAKPGAKFETILEQLFYDQIDGKIRSPQQLAKEFRKLAGIPEPAPPKPGKPAKKAKSSAP